MLLPCFLFLKYKEHFHKKGLFGDYVYNIFKNIFHNEKNWDDEDIFSSFNTYHQITKYYGEESGKDMEY